MSDDGECGAAISVDGQRFVCKLSDRHDTHPTTHAARGLSDDGRHWNLYWTGTAQEALS